MIKRISCAKDELYDEQIPGKKKLKKSDKSESEFTELNHIDYGFDVEDSVIYFHGDIQMGFLFDVVAKTRIILKNRPEEKKNDPITVMLNSNGGDVYEAFGLVDYFNSLPVKVNIIARGRAMSAAALILCCGTGLRAASKSTCIMLHEISTEIYGKSADIKANANHINDLEKTFYDFIVSRTNKSEEYWRQVCGKDFYMSADEAKEFGIIDKVI